MRRIAVFIAMALTVTACAQTTPTAGANHPAVRAGPMYATDAQRARAINYWLPQNQLSPDAGVEHPVKSNSLTS